jgi:hypothetical protein
MTILCSVRVTEKVKKSIGAAAAVPYAATNGFRSLCLLSLAQELLTKCQAMCELVSTSVALMECLPSAAGLTGSHSCGLTVHGQDCQMNE